MLFLLFVLLAIHGDSDPMPGPGATAVKGRVALPLQDVITPLNTTPWQFFAPCLLRVHYEIPCGSKNQCGADGGMLMTLP